MTSYLSLMIVALVVVAVILKLYTKLTTGWNESFTCLVGKTTLVTGSNTGIGYETAKEFAKRGAKVILACRNKERAEEAQRKIIEETGNTRIVVKLVDFSSLDSVRKFAEDIKASEERLDILVNNAGAGGLGKHITEDGLDITMQTNYFSSFLLSILLVDLLKKSAPSRIVNVSSVTAKLATIDPCHLNKRAMEFKLYCRSKLCNILFTQELARRLKSSGVTTYSLHPGAVITDFFRSIRSWYKIFITIATYLVLKTPLEGAQTQLHLSLSKNIEHLTGKHFHDCKVVRTYHTANVIGLAEKVWEVSEQLVSLRLEEKQL